MRHTFRSTFFYPSAMTQHLLYSSSVESKTIAQGLLLINKSKTIMCWKKVSLPLYWSFPAWDLTAMRRVSVCFYVCRISEVINVTFILVSQWVMLLIKRVRSWCISCLKCCNDLLLSDILFVPDLQLKIIREQLRITLLCMHTLYTAAEDI